MKEQDTAYIYIYLALRFTFTELKMKKIGEMKSGHEGGKVEREMRKERAGESTHIPTDQVVISSSVFSQACDKSLIKDQGKRERERERERERGRERERVALKQNIQTVARPWSSHLETLPAQHELTRSSHAKSSPITQALIRATTALLIPVSGSDTFPPNPSAKASQYES